MAALILEQHRHQHKQNLLKHFCKICKKGFACGRALGGHMRAHGILTDDDHDDDDDNNNPTTSHSKPNPPMYALRTNPNRLKTCRACENCGKEFLSWKSFLEHGKCTAPSDELDSLLSEDLDMIDDDEALIGASHNNRNNNWSKRKRSTRVKVGSPSSGNWNEEEELANCLMMLSNGTVEPMTMLEEDEESCGSASKEDHSSHRLHHSSSNNNNNVRTKATINFVPPISYRLPNYSDQTADKAKAVAPASTKGMFECKACKKVFNSHQALGGHRASHKKVKGCFAARLDHMDLDVRDDNNNNDDDVFEDSFFPTKPNNYYENGTMLASTSSKRKTKVHECSICHRIFSSGQALGGHKRCHWITSNATATVTAVEPPPPSSIAKIHHLHDQRVEPSSSPLVLPLDLKLDLNFPAPADEVRRPGLQVSTEINLKSWVCKSDKVDEHDSKQQQHPNDKHSINNDDNENNIVVVKNEEENNGKKNINNHSVEDEADSKMKLAKLSELKDMNMSGGNSSPWLQVGIGSTDVKE